jgi:hypothetical protein
LKSARQKKLGELFSLSLEAHGSEALLVLSWALSPLTPMELFTWPFYHYTYSFLLVVGSFMVNLFLKRCDDVKLIKEKSRS